MGVMEVEVEVWDYVGAFGIMADPRVVARSRDGGHLLSFIRIASGRKVEGGQAGAEFVFECKKEN